MILHLRIRRHPPYATALDYNPQTKMTKDFFKTVQNKLHFAIHDSTAAEVIYDRADSTKEHMGLTSWENAPYGKIVKSDVSIAKNYLTGKEIKSLDRFVTIYLDYAESQAERNIPKIILPPRPRQFHAASLSPPRGIAKFVAFCREFRLSYNMKASSSVKGLIAKPTVDILLEIDDDCDIEQLKCKLTNAGWLCMSYEDKPDLKMVFNKGYTPKGFAEKVFHLHVRYFEDWNELYFRDYLVTHSEIAEEYGKLKQSLKEQYEHNRDGYTEAKTDFIMKYTKIAREDFGKRYVPQNEHTSENGF